jgi:hypothetical protein
MSVASLSGYLANGGGGGGSDTFEKIYIGETGTQVELNCAIKDNLNVTGITTKEIGIYDDAGDKSVVLKCIKDGTLDIDNIDTFTLELYSTKTTKGSVVLNCESDNVLSVGNIKIADTGITFPDNSTQITAYTGGGDGNVFETITIGTQGSQVLLNCDNEAFLSISGEIAATQAWVNENFDITLVAGNGITIDESPEHTYTITNTGSGGGGAVNGITAGDGITITNDTQDVYTVNNSGVLALTAGNGMQITGTNTDKSINFYAFHTPLQKVVTIPFESLAPVAVGTVLPWISENLHPIAIAEAGVYFMEYSITFRGLFAQDAITPKVVMGEGYVDIAIYYTGSQAKNDLKKQYFSMSQSPQISVEVSGCSIFTATGAGYITADANCTWLGTQGETQGTYYTVDQETNVINAFALYKLY